MIMVKIGGVLLLLFLWSVTLFYIIAGGIFITLGSYSWNITFLPIYIFFSSLFAGSSVLASIGFKVLVLEKY